MHQVITHIIKIAFSLKIICCLLKLGFCFVTPTYRRGSRHRHRHRHCQCLQIRLTIKKQLWNQSYLLSDWFFERFMFVIMLFNFLLLILYTGALVKSIQTKRRGNREEEREKNNKQHPKKRNRRKETSPIQSMVLFALVSSIFKIWIVCM